jgi:hypothetical protein
MGRSTLKGGRLYDLPYAPISGHLAFPRAHKDYPPLLMHRVGALANGVKPFCIPGNSPSIPSTVHMLGMTNDEYCITDLLLMPMTIRDREDEI